MAGQLLESYGGNSGRKERHRMDENSATARSPAFRKPGEARRAVVH
jgi:hypothetical protein